MNPDTFTGRTDEEILSTLAHEMAHVWQQTYGSPPRRSYHDREWAAKMKEIALAPTATGAPGAKETGQSVSQYIVPEGPYAKTYTTLKATGFQLHCQSAPESKHALDSSSAIDLATGIPAMRGTGVTKGLPDGRSFSGPPRR